jgi:hypothetical protein
VRACACLLPYLRIKAEQAMLLVELSTYAGKDVRKAAYWYAQQHPTWTSESLLSTDEVSSMLGYESPASVYQAIHNGTLLAIPSRGNVRRPRIPAGLLREILAQRTGPTMAINRVRPPQLQQERERIFRRVRELNHVGVDEVSADDHAADLASRVTALQQAARPTQSPDAPLSISQFQLMAELDQSEYANRLIKGTIQLFKDAGKPDIAAGCRSLLQRNSQRK